MARIINLPKTKEDLRKIAERYWLRTDKDIHLVAFYPFRDFYGGYLVYEILNQAQNDEQIDSTDKRCNERTHCTPKRYKQFISNKMARKLGIKEVFIYGKRAT